MKKLSYIMYPICIIGAIYSLIYNKHKSWYSWAINSIVNGIYAFGFLFMTPQLFLNYKVKINLNFYLFVVNEILFKKILKA